MDRPYSDQSKALDVIGHLEELRKRIIASLAVLAVVSVVLFSQGGRLLEIAKSPLRGKVSELIFISPTEGFVSYVKVVLLCSFIISFPFILRQFWLFIMPALSAGARKRIFLWFLAALSLFFAGVAFSYFIFIPAALNFLINFAKDAATAKITIGRYVSFFGALIFAGGMIFQIPVIMAMLGEAGILKARFLRSKRHIAVIGMLVAAAIITPTQDIANMLIFAIPMFVLFEVGILVVALIENKNERRKK
jgi:sec-independent protein translocase protein TatC